MVMNNEIIHRFIFKFPYIIRSHFTKIGNVCDIELWIDVGEIQMQEVHLCL